MSGLPAWRRSKTIFAVAVEWKPEKVGALPLAGIGSIVIRSNRVLLRRRRARAELYLANTIFPLRGTSLLNLTEKRSANKIYIERETERFNISRVATHKHDVNAMEKKPCEICSKWMKGFHLIKSFTTTTSLVVQKFAELNLISYRAFSLGGQCQNDPMERPPLFPSS